jgi:hypothetical protein
MFKIDIFSLKEREGRGQTCGVCLYYSEEVVELEERAGRKSGRSRGLVSIYWCQPCATWWAAVVSKIDLGLNLQTGDKDR